MPTKSAKELLAERSRIDAAMSQLENAKLKANAQRAEYGRFLTWKVDLQRKERKQREEESQQLRERVEKKLTEVLKEHREHKKKELTAFREFVSSKVPKATKLSIATSFDRENLILAEAQAEKERRRMEWQQFRAEMGLRSAPDASESRRRSHSQPPRKSTADAVKASVGIQQRLHQQHNPTAGGFVSATPRAPPPPTKPEYVDDEGYDANLLRDKVGHMGGLVSAIKDGDEDGQLEQFSALRQSRIDKINRTEKKQEAVHKRAELMESMFNKARTRRLYAQNRIAADPPADYLIGTDILRYIPVDLIPGGAQFGEAADAPRKRGGHLTSSDGQAFFMTAVDSSRADAAVPQQQLLSLLEPSPPHEGGELHHSPRNETKKKRTKQFDAQSWHQQKFKGPIPELRQERVLEEEAAMYEWYQVQDQTSRRPSWQSRGYAWSRRGHDDQASNATRAVPKPSHLEPM